MLRNYSLLHENQDTHTQWKDEAIRSCLSWIEQQRLPSHSFFRLAGMAENADVRLFALKKHSPALR